VRLAAKGCPVFEKDVPLRVIIVLHFAMPTTWSKRKREQKRGKGNTQKPDFDGWHGHTIPSAQCSTTIAASPSCRVVYC